MPCFLYTLTIVTGLVDAVGFLRLDEVLVADMTGNIVLLCFGAGLGAWILSFVGIGAFRLRRATAPWTAAR